MYSFISQSNDQITSYDWCLALAFISLLFFAGPFSKSFHSLALWSIFLFFVAFLLFLFLVVSSISYGCWVSPLLISTIVVQVWMWALECRNKKKRKKNVSTHEHTAPIHTTSNVEVSGGWIYTLMISIFIDLQNDPCGKKKKINKYQYHYHRWFESIDKQYFMLVAIINISETLCKSIPAIISINNFSQYLYVSTTHLQHVHVSIQVMSNFFMGWPLTIQRSQFIIKKRRKKKHKIKTNV